MTELESTLFESAQRIDNDVNGNGRYYFPKFLFPPMTDKTRSKAGLVKYRGKRFGPGYILQSAYLAGDLPFVCEVISNA